MALSLPIELGDLSLDYACVLSGRNVLALTRPTPKQVTAFIGWPASQQAFDRLPRHLRDFELHRPTGLVLHDDPAIANKSARADVLRLETDQI